jgi:hypothetical protein
MANVPISNLTTTWNNAATTFTGFKFNVSDTASAAGSLLMDLQVGGASLFSVDKLGTVRARNSFILTSQAGIGTTYLQNDADALRVGRSGQDYFWARQDVFLINSAAAVAWGSISSNSSDLVIRRDAANTLAQRNGVNAQTFRLYNTFTDASNYERGFMRWNSNVLEIGSEGAGTGVGRTMRFVGSNPLQTVTFNGVTFQNFYSTEARGAVLISENIGLTTKDNYAVLINTLSNTESRLWLSASTNIQLTFEISAVKKNYFGSYAGAGHNLLIKAGQGSDQSGATNTGGNLLIRGGAGSNGGADGLVIMDNLPTANPLVTGALWNNAGVLSISAG